MFGCFGLYIYIREKNKKIWSRNRKKIIYILNIQKIPQNTQNTQFCIYFVQFPRCGDVKLWQYIISADSPWFWLQNTKPYQLPSKNSIFWSTDFEKIPFLPLFLYIFCTKMTQMTQMTHIFSTWKNFIKNMESRMEQKQKNIYM